MMERGANTGDSAGQPWAGRHFEPNPSAGDDGSAPPALIKAIENFHVGVSGQAEVVAAFRASRLLVPLLAELGQTGVGRDGRTVDKSQELSIVTVAGPDGRTVLPVFSSVEAMSTWNASARPVPATGPRVAAAAVGEGTDVVVLDPMSSTEFAVRRPALWSIVKNEDWLPCFASEEVSRAFESSTATESAILRVELGSGDPGSRLRGPELRVTLTLAAGLDPVDLEHLLARLSANWESSDVIARHVDSLEVSLTN